MENNNPTPNVNNSNDNKGYYTTVKRKLQDYFITLGTCIIIIVLISMARAESIFGLSTAFFLILLLVMILSFTYQRKFIGFAILTLALIPLVFIGSCFMSMG